MYISISKPKKLLRLDWRILLLITGFVIVLTIAVPFLPVELRVVALIIPLSVFATAAFTYWMVTPSTQSQVVLQKARIKTLKSGKMPIVSPLTVQELFDDLPIALLRVSKDGVIMQTNQFSRNILGIREGDTPNLSEIVSGLSRPVPD